MMAHDTKPLISIIIVNYHSDDDLDTCLESLSQQSLQDFEVILIDNENGNAFMRNIQSRYPVAKIICSVNQGYGAGNNKGIAVASGECVLVLNPDTQLTPDALEDLYQLSLIHPEALINPKLVLADGRINACGNSLHITGVASCAFMGHLADTQSGVMHPQLLSGAAIFAPKRIWQELGGFDASYFMYHEDCNLSLRARLAGFELLCANDVVVLHDYALSLNATKFYYLERNRLLTLMLIYSQRSLVMLMVPLLITELLMWLYGLAKGPRFLKVKLQSYYWLIQHRRDILVRRAKLQAKRVVKKDVWLKNCQTSLPFGQLIQAPILAKFLNYTSILLYAPWRWML